MKNNQDFIVRQAIISDAEDIYNINKTSLGYDYDLDKQRNNLEAVLNDKTQVIFVAVLGNKVVGYIHLTSYDVIYADIYKNCLGLAVDNDYKTNGYWLCFVETRRNVGKRKRCDWNSPLFRCRTRKCS